jgi:tetratricopeptide (TPR) repeat protein
MQRLLARTAESSHRLPPDRLWRLGLVMELHLALAPWEMEQRNRLAPADLKRAVEEGARRQAEVWANLRRAVPGNAEGWVGAATAALRRGDRPEAVRLLDAGLAAALPLGPHRPDRRWLAELRDRIAAPPVRSGTADPDAAADRPASEAEREATAEALRPVAESAAAAGRADRALEIARHVRRGVAERPPFWAASLEASRCLASGRSDGPEEAAAAMAPLKDEFLRTPDGVAMWAAALSGSGRADEIDPEAARAVTGSLSNVAAMVRGLILSDRAAAAASLADAVVRRRAGQKEARLLLAEALCESADDGDGNWDDRTVWRALDQCELLLKRSPADPRLLGRVVWLYCEGLGSAEEALRRGEPLLKAWKSSRAGGDPGRSGDPTGGTASGAATGDPGRTGDATGDGASGPLPVRALHALGVALLRKGRLPEAGDALRDALALASRSPDSLDAAEAPSLRLHLAEALLASGRPGDARLEWQSARSSAKLRRDRSAAERLAARFAEGK